MGQHTSRQFQAGADFVFNIDSAYGIGILKFSFCLRCAETIILNLLLIFFIENCSASQMVILLWMLFEANFVPNEDICAIVLKLI